MKRKSVLNQIIQDVESDVKSLDGKPCNGKIIATQFGNQGAMIQALAAILKTLIEDKDDAEIGVQTTEKSSRGVKAYS